MQPQVGVVTRVNKQTAPIDAAALQTSRWTRQSATVR